MESPGWKIMRTTLQTTGWLLIFLMGLAFTAYGNDVTVNIEEAVEIQYTGGAVDFYPDFGASSLGIMNQGHMLWWANVNTWHIDVERTEWTKSPYPNDWGDQGTSDIHLQIKKGPDQNTGWYTITTSHQETPWLTYNDIEEDEDDEDYGGSGQFTGVDWKIKEIGFEDGGSNDYGWLLAGVYTCTVTFTITTP